MSAIIDNNTALEAMKSSNEDVLTLISNLKSLLTGMAPVTFEMGDYAITVDSLLLLIDKYRNGKFDTIVLGGQSTGGKQVKLSVSPGGDLQITDMAGHLVGLKCDTLSHSYIVNSSARNVTAENCSIKSIKGRSSISGGSLKLQNLDVHKLVTDYLGINGGIIVKDLNVDGNISCSGLTIMGNRKLSVNSVRNVFYRNGAVDNVFVQLAFAIVNGIWDMSDTKYSPAIFGFTENKATLPGMICIQGFNPYNSLTPFKPLNMVADVSGTKVQVLPAPYDFPALMLWPKAYYTKETNQFVFVHFTADDNNKDIYYMTGSIPWKIYRTMETRDDGSIVFGTPYTIPTFSCIRFIVSRKVNAGSTVSILELA